MPIFKSVRREVGFFVGQAVLKQTLKTAKQPLREWYDLWFNEYKRAGYIAITDFNKQFFYGANDVSKVINATAGKKQQYISINAFDVDFQNNDFSREITRLKQIRNIAVDIDQYKLGLTIDEALDEIQSLILEQKLPEPNLILTSRGIQLFYTIDKGASPEMAWLAGYVTEQLISKLQHIGADNNAKDMSRVMRVPNSVNERNNSVVTPYIWNDEAYTLQELQTYCRPLEKFETRKKTKGKILPFNKRLAFFYKTNFARLTDLHKLLELRKNDLTGVRNVFLYMYSYHQSLVLNTQQEVILSVKNTFKDVYSTTDKPMSNKEVETTIKSAYKDAKGFFDSFIENDYKVIYRHNDGIKKPFKTSNFIKKLNITEDEQRAMRTLRNKEIAKEQHADYMRNKRLRDGTHKTNRQEYDNDRKKRKETITMIAIEMRKQGKTLQEIANLTKVSKGYISRLLKEANHA